MSVINTGSQSAGAWRWERWANSRHSDATRATSAGALTSTGARPLAGALTLLGPHVRKQDYVANAGCVGEQHHHAIHTDAAAGRRRHAEFQRADIVGIVKHRLLVACRF